MPSPKNPTPEQRQKWKEKGKQLVAIRAAKLAAMTPAQRNEYERNRATKAVATRRARLQEAQLSKAPLTQTLPIPMVKDSSTDIDVSETRAKIHWTLREMTTVIKAAVKYLMDSYTLRAIPGEDDKAGNLLVLDAIRHVQYNCLEKDRRRLSFNTKQAFSDVFWTLFQRELDDRWRERDNNRHLAGGPPPPAPSGIRIVPPLDQPAPAPAVALVPTPANPFDAMIDARLKQLLEPIQNSFVEEIDRLEKIIGGLGTQLAKLSPVNGYVPPEVKKPLVGIFNCRKDQFDLIAAGAKEAGLDLNLRHYEQDAPHHNITCEYALFLRFGQHMQWEQAINAGIPADKRAFIRGSITSAVRQLEVWFAP